MTTPHHKTASERLDVIIDEFADLEQRERLELLLEFAESLPPLPPEYQKLKDAGGARVQECQTEVHLWVDVRDGLVDLHAFVAPEAPTVQGFVSILIQAFSGAKPEEVLAVQQDVLKRLGLIESLGMVRMRGLSSIFNRVLEKIRLALAKLA